MIFSKVVFFSKLNILGEQGWVGRRHEEILGNIFCSFHLTNILIYQIWQFHWRLLFPFPVMLKICNNDLLKNILKLEETLIKTVLISFSDKILETK